MNVHKSILYFPLDAKGLKFDSNSYVIHVDIYMYILSRCIDRVYGFIDNLLRLLDNYQLIWFVRNHEMKHKNTNKILFIVSFDENYYSIKIIISKVGVKHVTSSIYVYIF